LVPLKIVSNVSRFKPALNLNRVLADLNRGSNSLNSISDLSISISQSGQKFCISQSELFIWIISANQSYEPITG